MTLSEPARTGRPTAKAQRELGDRILAVAEGFFLSRGYDGTSMAAIAAEARVGKQTLYRRYPNKAALFREVFNRRVEASIVTPRAALDRADPVKTVRILVRAAFDITLDADFIALQRTLIAEVANFPELIAYAGEWGVGIIALCAEAITVAQDLGFAPKGDAPALANSLIWSVVGAPLYDRLSGAPAPVPGPDRDALFEARWAASIMGIGR